ncbi:mitochondrial transcription termination factorfamily protein [Striga asiatica]|uniref:Transcription termination factor MTERF4, chloroplastic n=1 Tax=Striga asiatica TaxID=4170 RepID=A0A5A7R8E0_STRAF|nr:mitochondrial transcription termination factorfamily protein [Striga asiatica]
MPRRPYSKADSLTIEGRGRPPEAQNPKEPRRSEAEDNQVEVKVRPEEYRISFTHPPNLNSITAAVGPPPPVSAVSCVCDSSLSPVVDSSVEGAELGGFSRAHSSPSRAKVFYQIFVPPKNLSSISNQGCGDSNELSLTLSFSDTKLPGLHDLVKNIDYIDFVSSTLTSMKIASCAGLAKPTFLLAHYELPSFSLHRPQFISITSLYTPRKLKNRCEMVMRIHSSIAGRNRSPRPKQDRFKREQEKVNPASLYTHPTLLEMKNERIANRARVYEFLKGIGIIPDELDGLELPVTADVMKERVHFLHKLGLTIEDINNYPLVLGCSVKKNMVPVLDYLGKLGVRKSTFTEFLRRYPQVLHASVVVDLEPVVKYLLGMDVKPENIPRVLEKYPEVLGFKLEGTMSTSVAYLVGIGVARREIGGILTRYPEILGMRVARVLKPFVEYLGSLGIPELAVARLIEKRPHILGFGLDERVRPNVSLLLEYHVRRSSISGVIAQYPEIMGIDLAKKLQSQRGFFTSVIELSPEDFGRVIEKMPQVVSLSDRAVVRHVDFLKGCKFSSDQVRKMVLGCPQVLALNLDIMRLSFEYFASEMGRPLDDLVSFPAYFTYGLESTVKPRNKIIARKGVKCSLSWLLNCSDEKFEERMDYDSIDVEEMEVDSSSFDMSSLMKPNDEESDTEYEDDSEDDQYS